MVIACDTSFLFSLYGTDANTPQAVAWLSRNEKPLFLNSPTHYEFGNALRFSEFRKAIPPGFAARAFRPFSPSTKARARN